MHTQANDGYVPFGGEWRREMMPAALCLLAFLAGFLAGAWYVLSKRFVGVINYNVDGSMWIQHDNGVRYRLVAYDGRRGTFNAER